MKCRAMADEVLHGLSLMTLGGQVENLPSQFDLCVFDEGIGDKWEGLKQTKGTGDRVKTRLPCINE